MISSPDQLLINLSPLMQRSTGISVYTKNLLPTLKQLNPTLLSAEAIADFKCEKIDAGLSPEHGFLGHLKRLAWLQIKLPEYYYKLHSSLIFSPLPEAPIYRGCRYVVTVHDVIPLRFPRPLSPLTNYFKFYVPTVLSQAQHIICDSVSTAKDISQYYGIPIDKISPILLAYDRHKFKPSGVSQGNYFIYLGRQDPYKNLSRLISSFHKAFHSSETELWFVGPKDKRYTPELVSKVKTLGLENRIRWFDYVSYDELPKLLEGAIALVFPSLWEGFGLPVLEAMACGTPVITSHQSSLPEVAGEAAIFINPYNVDEMADAMKTLESNSQLRQQLRVAGIERAKLFSWEKTGNQTLEVLRNYL